MTGGKPQANQLPLRPPGRQRRPGQPFSHAFDQSGKGALGLALAQSGNTAEARELLERLRRMAATAYVPPTAFAWIHLGLGDADSAFEWLDRAIDARDQLMMPIKSYPIFDPIRSDPRFAGLLRKMNLDS